jgi:hypothetical protein
MFSERRCAQFGLASAGLLLVTTLTILYHGSQSSPAADQEDSGPGMVSEDRTSNQSAHTVKVAMTK